MKVMCTIEYTDNKKSKQWSREGYHSKASVGPTLVLSFCFKSTALLQPSTSSVSIKLEFDKYAC